MFGAPDVAGSEAHETIPLEEENGCSDQGVCWLATGESAFGAGGSEVAGASLAQRAFQLGFRFATNARGPSAWSSLCSTTSR